MSKYSFELSVKVRNQTKNENMFQTPAGLVWENLDYEQLVIMEAEAVAFQQKMVELGQAAVKAKKAQAVT